MQGRPSTTKHTALPNTPEKPQCTTKPCGMAPSHPRSLHKGQHFEGLWRETIGPGCSSKALYRVRTVLARCGYSLCGALARQSAVSQSARPQGVRGRWIGDAAVAGLHLCLGPSFRQRFGPPGPPRRRPPLDPVLRGPSVCDALRGGLTDCALRFTRSRSPCVSQAQCITPHGPHSPSLQVCPQPFRTPRVCPERRPTFRSACEHTRGMERGGDCGFRPQHPLPFLQTPKFVPMRNSTWARTQRIFELSKTCPHLYVVKLLRM